MILFDLLNLLDYLATSGKLTHEQALACDNESVQLQIAIDDCIIDGETVY